VEGEENILEVCNYMNLVNIKIKKYLAKLTFPKKAKIKFDVELDTTITYVEALRL